MKFIVVIFKIILFVYVLSEDCTDIVITDFSVDNCIAKQTLNSSYYYEIGKNCLPTCTPYRESYTGIKCQSCVPGYMCQQRCSASNDANKKFCTTDADCKKFKRSRCQPLCGPSASTCMAYHANTSEYRENVFTALKFKPSCQNDGFWKAKQCKGGNSGRCICYDKYGVRLFGEAPHSKAKDMTCACSRRRAELSEAGRDYTTLHCNQLGNFEPLQCDSGLCWCAEEQTGDLTSIVVPQKAMYKLPCYDVSKVGSQYLRQCDSVKYAMAKIEQTLKNHGVTYINLGIKLCDGDGAYGLYNISDGLAYCTLRSGKKIGAYQSDPSTNIATLTCRCARDLALYNHGLTCEGNGNYRAYQSVIQNKQNYDYCVDEDGFQKSDLLNKLPENCSIYY